MSHDRGCPCGRERWDYDTCTDPNCTRSPQIPIPQEAYDLISNPKGNKQMIRQTTEQRYVWILADGEAKIITDPVAVYQGPYFDREKDRIYVLGNEVEVKITVEVKNKPVYRESASGYRTPFENRD